MDQDLVDQAIDYHGPTLCDKLHEERHQVQLPHFLTLMNMQPKYRDAPLDHRFQQQLAGFVGTKADILFEQNASEYKPVDAEENSEELYSVVPPLESFMDVNGFTRREHFYKSVKAGDFIFGQIAAIQDHGVVITVICTDPRGRYIDDLRMPAYCPVRDVPKYYAHESPLEAFAIKDKVKAVVMGVQREMEKLTVSMHVNSLPDDSKQIKLGLVTDEEFPTYYRNLQNISGKGFTYQDCLARQPGFSNCSNVETLCSMVGIEDGKPLSLFRGLHKISFPEDEYADGLRKKQSARLALKSVADGIQKFKENKHSEAMQHFNKALQIDPENVEAVVARGAVYANNESYERAIEDFTLALKYDPNHVNAKKYKVETIVVFVRTLFEQDPDDQGLIGHLKSALELDGENEEAREMLIKVHERSEKAKDKRSIAQPSPEKKAERRSSMDRTTDTLKKLIEEDDRSKRRKSGRRSGFDDPPSRSPSPDSRSRRKKQDKEIEFFRSKRRNVDQQTALNPERSQSPPGDENSTPSSTARRSKDQSPVPVASIPIPDAEPPKIQVVPKEKGVQSPVKAHAQRENSHASTASCGMQSLPQDAEDVPSHLSAQYQQLKGMMATIMPDKEGNQSHYEQHQIKSLGSSRKYTASRSPSKGYSRSPSRKYSRSRSRSRDRSWNQRQRTPPKKRMHPLDELMNAQAGTVVKQPVPTPESNYNRPYSRSRSRSRSRSHSRPRGRRDSFYKSRSRSRGRYMEEQRYRSRSRSPGRGRKNYNRHSRSRSRSWSPAHRRDRPIQNRNDREAAAKPEWREDEWTRRGMEWKMAREGRRENDKSTKGDLRQDSKEGVRASSREKSLKRDYEQGFKEGDRQDTKARDDPFRNRQVERVKSPSREVEKKVQEDVKRKEKEEPSVSNPESRHAKEKTNTKKRTKEDIFSGRWSKDLDEQDREYSARKSHGQDRRQSTLERGQSQEKRKDERKSGPVIEKITVSLEKKQRERSPSPKRHRDKRHRSREQVEPRKKDAYDERKPTDEKFDVKVRNTRPTNSSEKEVQESPKKIPPRVEAPDILPRPKPQTTEVQNIPPPKPAGSYSYDPFAPTVEVPSKEVKLSRDKMMEEIACALGLDTIAFKASLPTTISMADLERMREKLGLLPSVAMEEHTEVSLWEQDRRVYQSPPPDIPLYPVGSKDPKATAPKDSIWNEGKDMKGDSYTDRKAMEKEERMRKLRPSQATHLGGSIRFKDDPEDLHNDNQTSRKAEDNGQNKWLSVESKGEKGDDTKSKKKKKKEKKAKKEAKAMKAASQAKERSPSPSSPHPMEVKKVQIKNINKQMSKSPPPTEKRTVSSGNLHPGIDADAKGLKVKSKWDDDSSSRKSKWDAEEVPSKKQQPEIKVHIGRLGERIIQDIGDKKWAQSQEKRKGRRSSSSSSDAVSIDKKKDKKRSSSRSKSRSRSSSRFRQRRRQRSKSRSRSVSGGHRRKSRSPFESRNRKRGSRSRSRDRNGRGGRRRSHSRSRSVEKNRRGQSRSRSPRGNQGQRDGYVYFKGRYIKGSYFHIKDANKKQSDDREDSNRGRDDSNRGRDDSNRGRDDSNRGRDDSNKGRDDSHRGREDSNRGREDNNRDKRDNPGQGHGRGAVKAEFKPFTMRTNKPPFIQGLAAGRNVFSKGPTSSMSLADDRSDSKSRSRSRSPRRRVTRTSKELERTPDKIDSSASLKHPKFGEIPEAPMVPTGSKESLEEMESFLATLKEKKITHLAACGTCGEKFSTVAEMALHDKIKHSLKCVLCDFRCPGPEAKMKERMARHMEKKH